MPSTSGSRSDGVVLRELDVDGARTAIAELRDRGVEALTVSLMNSFANPEHERAVAELAAEDAPLLPVSISSEILPEFREYERTVTTVMNAYVSPVLDRYLSSLRNRLEQVGAGRDLQVVRSDGGLMSLDSARSTPVHTVLSGPAGGVQGASYVAAHAGFDRILTFDMGGTSTDVATCVGGEPSITRETSVGEFPVRAPSVEVESIGAGGGSIAYVAEVTGALRVGPRSAGADPGPACYGRGGTEATVTDANLVQGHLPPRLLGGAMELDVEAADAAVGRLAKALGLDPRATAAGIVDIVNENMLGALRVVTVQKGLTPERLRAGLLRRRRRTARQRTGRAAGLLPGAGAARVRGAVGARFRRFGGQERVQPDLHPRRRRRPRPRRCASGCGSSPPEADDWLEAEHVAAADRATDYVVDMRYRRQGFEIPIEVSAAELGDLTVRQLVERFNEVHHRLYGFGLEGGAELVNLRAIARGSVPTPEIPGHDRGPTDPAAARLGSQTVWIEGEGREVADLRALAAHRGHANPGPRDRRAVRRDHGHPSGPRGRGRPLPEPADLAGGSDR